MKRTCDIRASLIVPLLLAAFGATFGLAAADDNATIAGVWRAREGTPTGMTAGLTSSDVQTLVLTADGRYRREIVAEGGERQTQASGTILDSGTYTFRLPSSFRYRRRSWVVCAPVCLPYAPIGPNSGALTFEPKGSREAVFLGLLWRKAP
jgi:hypothetical protein